jgi:hypothetical protein
MIAAFIGFGFGALLMLLSIKGNPFHRDQKFTIMFLDGTSFQGIRKSKYIGNETYGTHHFTVLSSTDDKLQMLVGLKVAVPINSVKYFIIEGK